MSKKAIGNPKIVRNGKNKDKFNLDVHTRFWKKYSIRPANGDKNPTNSDSRYCIYDEPSGHYRYTKMWVDFLIEKMQIDGEFESLYN